MNLFKKIEKLKWKWYEFSLVKLSVMFSTLFLITAWEGFRNLILTISWYWYLIIAIILTIPILKKIFCKKS